MLSQQLADTEQGIPLSNRVEIDRLPAATKSELKSAVSKVAAIVDMVSEGRM
jgi:hypothetical protein